MDTAHLVQTDRVAYDFCPPAQATSMVSDKCRDQDDDSSQTIYRQYTHVHTHVYKIYKLCRLQYNHTHSIIHGTKFSHILGHS